MISRILHIILAFFVFFSSMGFVFNKHYCQDELKNVALFVEAESCHSAMDDMPASCPMHPPQKKACEEKKDCCDDQSELVKSEQPQDVQNSEFQLLNKTVCLGVIFLALHIDYTSIDVQSNHFHNYKPPLIVCNTPASLQTFLL